MDWASKQVKNFVAGIAVSALIVVIVVLIIPGQPVFKEAPPPLPDPKQQNIDLFYQTCIAPVQNRQPVPYACRNPAAIRQTFGIDPMLPLNIELGEAVMTAKRVARGEILTRDQYEACLSRGRCVQIPLAPKNVSSLPASLRPQEITKTQNLFAHLLNHGSLTRDLCPYINMCEAYFKLGLIQFSSEGTVITP